MSELQLSMFCQTDITLQKFRNMFPELSSIKDDRLDLILAHAIDLGYQLAEQNKESIGIETGSGFFMPEKKE